MKEIIPFSSVLFIIISLANSQSWRSSNQLYGTSDLSVLKHVAMHYENTYLFGYFNGSINVSATEQIDSRGGRDLFLAKYDTESNLLWAKGLGGALNEFLLWRNVH